MSEFRHPELIEEGDHLVARIPLTFKRRGGRKEVISLGCKISEPAKPPRTNRPLAVAIARAHRWMSIIESGQHASLREGLEETFTVARLGVSPMLRKCLTTTNIIESSLSGVENRTGRVTRWRSGEMALRWAAAAALETERNFRKIMGHKGLWMLKAVLDEGQSLSDRSQISVDEGRVAA